MIRAYCQAIDFLSLLVVDSLLWQASNLFFKRLHITTSSVLVIFSLLVSLPAIADKSGLLEQAHTLDTDFIRLADHIYQTHAERSSQQTPGDIDNFANRFKELIRNADRFTLTTYIHQNKYILLENSDHPVLQTVLRFLLEENDMILANQLFTAVEEEGDFGILSTINFYFAKYYSVRHRWHEVITLLENSLNDLADDDYAYGQLLTGVALQHEKEHRKALVNLANIKTGTAYSTAAQINIAIAQLKQGWWSDSNETVEALIQSSHDKELINKLHLYIGYAMLKQEFYQYAREAFRKVDQNSRYTNRALLGIGISAASYGDFAGGIHALSLLKKRKPLDLSVEEAYVILPFIYEKAQQDSNVIRTHNEAMNYYQKRIKDLEKMKQSSLQETVLDKESRQIRVQNTIMDYDAEYPESIMQNINLLKSMLSHASSDEQQKIRTLLSKFTQLQSDIFTENINQRIKQLTYYLNQSRYGLARFYDKHSKAAEE